VRGEYWRFEFEKLYPSIQLHVQFHTRCFPFALSVLQSSQVKEFPTLSTTNSLRVVQSKRRKRKRKRGRMKWIYNCVNVLQWFFDVDVEQNSRVQKDVSHFHKHHQRFVFQYVWLYIQKRIFHFRFLIQIHKTTVINYITDNHESVPYRSKYFSIKREESPKACNASRRQDSMASSSPSRCLTTRIPFQT
jgi:hypothetical protein